MLVAFPHRGVRELPAPNSGGEFGAARKYDIHTGVDLYCPEATEVVAAEAGTVVAVVQFTGPEAGSPWWHPTQAVLIESSVRVLCYGEVHPTVSIGDRVEPGQGIGRVLRVLKNDKGRPTSMLHFEVYCHGTREPVWWRHGDPQPDALLDPTPLLLSLLETL